MNSGIRNWPEEDRPREKLARGGAHLLSDAELLAIVLRTGEGGRSALDLGREILQRFGDLRKLAGASVAELCEVRGTGPAKAASLKAALELANRFKARKFARGETFTSPEQVFEHFHYAYRHEKKEHFLVLLLDGKNRVVREVKISEGSLNQSIVHPREVFNVAVRESAAGIILIHNHPTGDPNPSGEDVAVTKRLKEAGEIVGVKVLDHIIIGDGTFVSMAARGIL